MYTQGLTVSQQPAALSGTSSSTVDDTDRMTLCCILKSWSSSASKILNSHSSRASNHVVVQYCHTCTPSLRHLQSFPEHFQSSPEHFEYSAHSRDSLDGTNCLDCWPRLYGNPSMSRNCSVWGFLGLCLGMRPLGLGADGS